ncbi:MAG: hypothetical protein GC183_13530 [Thiobacillus sp.]|nr:hypothetical protein [Thiobacillus sp.]
MKKEATMQKWVAMVVLMALGCCMSACATGLLGGDNWKEEALQYDGSTLVVERSQSYGGRAEIGQGAPIREYHLSFTLPGSRQTIEWESGYSEDVGRANLHPLALHVMNGTPYVITEPNLCLAYNKWGRPNPPYVIFKYDGQAWQRIPIEELPTQFKDMNLVNETKGDAKRLVEAGQVTPMEITKLNRDLQQPELKVILRTPLSKERINQMCMEMVPYNGSWVMPNDPIARKYIDMQKR